MNRYDNLFRTKGLDKQASSEYDRLMVSNRQVEKAISIPSFSPVENEGLADYIRKEAKVLDADELTKEASEGITKEAFFSGGLDMFTSTRQLIANRLGVSEEIAHDMTSPVLNRSDVIRNQYGGEPQHIIEGIVTELATQTSDNPIVSKGVELHDFKSSWGKKEWSEAIKDRLVTELGIGSYDADRMVLLIVKESQDLTTSLRPHTKFEISEAIIQIMKENGDPSVIYGFKDSSRMMSLIKEYLN